MSLPMPDNARLAALISRVSRSNIERDVRHLSTAYPTRHTMGQYLHEAAAWLQTELKAHGARNVRYHEYERAGKRLRNVLADKPSALSGKPNKTILVSAHYDSRMQNGLDSASPAPGANDNATGVAVLLELARLLMPIPCVDAFRFCLFSGEEQGLWGSTAYVPEVKKERLDIRFIFNLDQIGYPPPDRAIYIDRDEGNRTKDNDTASAALVARIQELAKTVVKVPTRVDPAFGTDYIPFEAAGFVITGLYEAGKNYPHYHKSSDTFDKVDFAYVHDMARLALATLLAEGGML
jgi:Zn-dependent M28 family amino/carboxypeptidase